MNGRTSKLLRRLAVAELAVKPGFQPRSMRDVRAAAKANVQPLKKRWNSTPRRERLSTRLALIRILINLHEGAARA